MDKLGPQVELSIIVPAHPDKDMLPSLLKRIALTMGSRRYEVIIAAKDRPHATRWLCGELEAAGHPCRLVTHPTGLAAAVAHALELATGDYLAHLPLGYPPEALPRMLARMAGKEEDREPEVIVAAAGQASARRARLSRLLMSGMGLSAKNPFAEYFLLPRSVYQRAEGGIRPATTHGVLPEILCRGRVARVTEEPIRMRDGQEQAVPLREQLRFVLQAYRLYRLRYRFAFRHRKPVAVAIERALAG